MLEFEKGMSFVQSGALCLNLSCLKNIEVHQGMDVVFLYRLLSLIL